MGTVDLVFNYLCVKVINILFCFYFFFFSSVRERANSTSTRPSQFCIKDMAAFFEQKQ